jgi:hypothetical protein
MKKLLFSTLFLIGALQCHAQQTFLFRIKFLPKHNYASTVHTSMDMQMTMSGTEQQMKEMEKQGVKQPITITSISDKNLNIITGSVSDQNVFPFKLKYVAFTSKMLINGEEKKDESPLTGNVIYGHTNLEGKSNIDSIPGKIINENLKNAITLMVNSLQGLVKFPDKPLNVGESFSQDIPLTIPVAGINMQMTIKINFKLISVTDNMANFDLDETLVFDMKTNEENVNFIGRGSGKGSGKLIYSIKDNYPVNMDQALDFNFNIDTKDMKIDAKAKSLASHKTIVTNN